MLLAAMRRSRFPLATESAREFRESDFALPHRALLLPHRDFLRDRGAGLHGPVGKGASTKDLICSNSLRSAGRLSRWLSAPPLLLLPLLPPPPGLITALIDIITAPIATHMRDMPIG